MILRIQLFGFLALTALILIAALVPAASAKLGVNGNTTTPELHQQLLRNQRQLVDEETPSSRIVGGSPATLGAFPSFAYWNQGCGASLITPQIALTAAHCYVGNPGIIYLNSIERQTGDAFAVDYVRIHPRFNGNRDDPDWDYMILKLKQAVPGTVATPVVLNTDPNLPRLAGEIVTAVGFGRRAEGAKEDSATLQRVGLPFVPDTTCTAAYNEVRINEATVCAGQEGMDACQGDSGGPLYLGSTGQVQIGITSWGMVRLLI